MTVEEMHRKSYIILNAVENDNTAQGDYLLPELIAMKQLFEDLYAEYKNLLDQWTKYEEYGGF